MRRDELMHYGMPRRSGRYPWGSGEDPYQHSGDFMNRVNELRKQGVSEVDIAKMVGCRFDDESQGILCRGEESGSCRYCGQSEVFACGRAQR